MTSEVTIYAEKVSVVAAISTKQCNCVAKLFTWPPRVTEQISRNMRPAISDDRTGEINQEATV